MFLVICCILTGASGSLAQGDFSIDLGIRAGRPLKPDLKLRGSQYDSLIGYTQTKHDAVYIVGPAIALNLTNHLSVRFDALYKPLGYDTSLKSTVSFYQSFQTTTHATWWEFPITGQWRFSGENWRPFVTAGTSLNHVKGTTLDGSHVGFVTGGGVELKAGHFRMVPELRYTRWPLTTYTPGLYAWPNQFDVFVGFVFRKDRNTETQQHKFRDETWKK